MRPLTALVIGAAALAAPASLQASSPWQRCPDGTRIRKSQTCPTPSPTPAPTPTPTPTSAPAPSPTPTPSTGGASVPSGYAIKQVTGIHCDGVADDTTAIQSALDALPANAALQLPAGTCVTSNILRIGPGKTNAMLFGAGKDATIIRATNPSASAVVGTQNAGLILQGFQVTSPNATSRAGNGNTDGIYVEKSSGVLIDNVKIQHVAGAGMMLWTVNGGTIQNSEVDGSLADGFHITASSQNIILQFNIADKVGDDAFASIGYSPSQNRNISILNNQSYDGAWAGGIGIEGTVGVTITGNKIYRAGIAGIRVDSQGSYTTAASDQINISNNYLEGCVTRTNTGHGSIMIYVDWSGGYVHGITGSDNQIVNPTSGAGVRAFGYSSTNDVQASLLNTSMTGVAMPYSIGSFASVTRQ